MRSQSLVPLLLACLLTSGGCLIEGDRPAGRMSVRLHFDELRGPNPEQLDWQLYEVSGERMLVQDAECAFVRVEPRGMMVCTDLAAGLYELSVQAQDGERRWSRRCLGLVIDRFEERYECEVDLSTSDRATTDDADVADSSAENGNGEGTAGMPER